MDIFNELNMFYNDTRDIHTRVTLYLRKNAKKTTKKQRTLLLNTLDALTLASKLLLQTSISEEYE
jgi:hypothetical protein